MRTTLKPSNTNDINPKLLTILRCPKCGSSILPSLRCSSCNEQYSTTGSVIQFLDSSKFQDVYTIHEFYEGMADYNVGYIPGESRLKDWAFFELCKSGLMGQLKQVIERFESSDLTAVEFACGGGIAWVASLATTVGVDISLSSLQVAANVYDLTLQADIRDVPLADNCADLVWGSYFYEHLNSRDKDLALGEMYRTLKPGGWCILQFDSLGDNALMRFARHDTERFEKGFVVNDGHIGLEPLPQAIERIANCGFKIRRVMKFGTTPLQYLVVYNWLCMGYKDKYRWVRLLDTFKDALASRRIGFYWELAVTAFDRAINPFSKASKATIAIVVSQKAEE
ncbi:MAG: hypothetical protein C4318_06845 [Acidimicrobiia bacterium]